MNAEEILAHLDTLKKTKKEKNMSARLIKMAGNVYLEDDLFMVAVKDIKKVFQAGQKRAKELGFENETIVMTDSSSFTINQPYNEIQALLSTLMTTI